MRTEDEQRIIYMYGEFISKTTKSMYAVFGTPTGKRLIAKSSKCWATQSEKKPGLMLYKGATPCDVSRLFICAIIDTGKLSVPDEVSERAFLDQINEEVSAAEVAGTFSLNEYVDSLIKRYPIKAGAK